MKRKYFVVLGVVLLLLVAGLVILRQRRSNTPVEGWSLSEEGAIYVIHGAQDYDTGPGYYLYKIHKGETSVARIDSESSADLTHFTDRPVILKGRVKTDSKGNTTVFITDVQRAE